MCGQHRLSWNFSHEVSSGLLQWKPNGTVQVTACSSGLCCIRISTCTFSRVDTLQSCDSLRWAGGVNVNAPPSVSVTSASAGSSTAAPPGLPRGRRDPRAAPRRSWHSGSRRAPRPGRAGCWRWKHPRRAPRAPPTRPPGNYPAAVTRSAPETCSGGGRWRCCPACPQWWWGRGGCTALRCCGCHLKMKRRERRNNQQMFERDKRRGSRIRRGRWMKDDGDKQQEVERRVNEWEQEREKMQFRALHTKIYCRHAFKF